jgi:GMP synthase-like glutamine amidotransferase
MGLKAHWFQHVPFEGLGSIGEWLVRKGAHVSSTCFFERAVLPVPDDLDLLIVMGGPMSVNDEDAYPWLKEEKELIARAINRGTSVLGICLGAQLIANALGARVRRNDFSEIGWFPVESVDDGAKGDLDGILPHTFEAFHWHGETFDLPQGSRHLARNDACANQAFAFADRVLALQFHLETTSASALALVESCRADLAPGRFVQTEDAVLGTPDQFRRINAVMSSVLDRLPDSR